MIPQGPLRSFDAPEPIMRAAGAWLARRDRGFTLAEQHEFERWVGADQRHEMAVAQLDRTMTAFDRLREIAPADLTHLDPDVFAPPRSARGWFLPSLIGAGVAAGLAIIFWSGRPAGSLSNGHYTTASDGYQRVTLTDGSTIELNSDTDLFVEFTVAERRVRLSRGEAHFQVAKDAARPFRVTAETIVVNAVGTAFNVRVAPAGVEVLVTEGRVRVGLPVPVRALPDAASVAADDVPLIAAGQRILVPTEDRARRQEIAVVSAKEIDRALVWRSRMAEFRKTPLVEVVNEFNRRNPRQIVIVDPSLAGLRIGGNFRTDQPDAFVRLLESSFGIVAERSGEEIELRTRP